VTGFPVGEWDGGRLAEADPSHYGLLVIDGVLAREVVLGGLVSTELLGSGDVVRPWQLDGTPRLLPVEIRWNALTDVRLALLDRRAATQLGAYPEIGAMIVDRLSERAQRLAVVRAISRLTRVEEKLQALFWHLAERWGHVAADGITVPLALPHRLIGELIGARRPTVSTALAELAVAGRVQRREDGTWLLAGEGPSADAPDPVELVRQRRRLIPHATRTPAPAATARIEELRASLAAAHETAAERARDLEALRVQSTALRERTTALRRERLQRRP
jgi:hypothetical protein